MYTVNKVFLLLMLVNSCANPVVYAFQSRLFRRDMVNILCLCKRRSCNRVNFSMAFKNCGESAELSSPKLTRFVQRGNEVRGLEFSYLGVL
jgi:hypothetical protein